MRILMMEYLPLVSDYAKNLRSTLPVELDLDDLMQAGSFGLKEAIESFDPNQGAKFETHCVPRIRGAILDEWRNMDWAPGPVSGRSSGDIQTSWQLETKPGRASTEEEIQAHLVVPADESGKKRNDSDAVSEVSRSRKWFEAESDKDIRRIGAPRNRDSDSPLAMLHQPDLKELLTSGLSRLEKMILVLHYHEGMAMKEIGDALELTESKVADLHADVIARLKKRVADPDFMLAILGR
jgi:RNA polymerase sigma factor for flagellar operon FliA